jgi:hypothetical protein
MISVTTSYARKTDWSKVGLSSTNKCNEYTFKLTGVSDTNCMSYRFVEITTVSSQVLLRRQNGSSTYNITFPSKGKYYATVLIMNKCNGDDTVFVDTINVTCFPTTIKCDWSKVTLTQQNVRNQYRFTLGGINLDDTCIDYMYIVYTQQTKQIDTMSSFNGKVDIVFSEKGKYNVYLKIRNRCEICDTALVREINIAYFNQCKYPYKLSSSTNTCNDSITAEMTLGTTSKTDTCWGYYQYIYRGWELDSLTQRQWDSMSDQQLINYYNFSDNDLVKIQGPQQSARVLKYNFPFKDTRYLVIAQWFNKCTGQDTFMIRRFTIEKCNKTSVKPIVKNEDLKIIGYYDMIGRKVEYMEADKPYVIIYSNGKRQKVIKLK